MPKALVSYTHADVLSCNANSIHAKQIIIIIVKKNKNKKLECIEIQIRMAQVPGAT